MDILDERIPEGFNIKPKYIKKIKYMYIVKSERGSFIIRRVSADKDRIMFCDCIKERIRRKGFRRIEMFERSAQGLPYFELEGANYIMTAAVRDCQTPDYTDVVHMKEIVKAFAGLHKTAVFGALEEFGSYLGGDITESFLNMLKELKRLKRLVGRKRRLDDIDYIFIKNYDYFLKLGESSVEGLYKFGYKTEESRARREGRIAVNNVDEETMYINSSGVYMTDLLNLSVSSQLEDIKQLISRYLKKCTFPQMDICEIIKTYTSICPLGDRQLKLLYYMLKFPDRYITTYSDYYKKGHVFTPVYVHDSIQNIIDERDKHDLYISKLHEL